MSKTSRSSQLSRREFMKMVTVLVGGVIGTVLGLPLISYLLSPGLKTQNEDEWISLGALEDYPIDTPRPSTYTRTRVNGWERTATYYGAYVSRKSGNELAVFSDVCTHLGCRVFWRSDIQQYVCPCHDGHFGEDGEVLSGPPPRPLDQYESKINNGIILVRVSE
jgi:menaquinol-cytochrome c reductase iron-sulfur subunit